MPQQIFHRFSLNIRQKVLLSIVVAFLGFGLLGSISYHYLLQIDEALRLAEVVDDLSNDILEIRRYEKNYLLYALEEDFRESLQYVQRGVVLIDRLTAPAGDGSLTSEARDFARLRSSLQEFGKAFEHLAEISGKGNPAKLDTARNALRERGKDLVDSSQDIVLFQRERILGIVTNLKHQLLFSIFAFLAMGLAFAWFVGLRIINALHAIENSTVQIARGRFEPLPVPASRDETRNVVQAFNRMIVELDKRQNQLLQEKKLASLGVLTSGIAHQLNNPLNNISTSCQILREEGLGGEDSFARQMLDNIYNEVLRSRDIVKGLLEFSRETEFSLKPASLSELVERSARLVASQLPAGIEIVRQVPEDLVAPMDVQRMQEVLLNLLINASQAIKTLPGTITVSAERDEAAGQAVIRVRDTGTGIKREHLGRIFDPFFTLKEVGKGTGLGLSIVFGIVKKHGGTVTAESEEGQGATFIIRLPLGGTAGEGQE